MRRYAVCEGVTVIVALARMRACRPGYARYSTLDVIERGTQLWSNPGDTILSPFMGIGSEGHVALKTGRKFIGIELKESYYKQAVLNLKSASGTVQGELF